MVKDGLPVSKRLFTAASLVTSCTPSPWPLLIGTVAKSGSSVLLRRPETPHRQVLDGQVERVGTRMSAAGVEWRDKGAGEAHE